jgi:hypothetical protein
MQFFGEAVVCMVDGSGGLRGGIVYTLAALLFSVAFSLY